MFQQWRHSALEPAVIFPAILVLLRRSNFIGVRFIEITCIYFVSENFLFVKVLVHFKESDQYLFYLFVSFSVVI